MIILPDGRWGAIEVELGGPQMVTGAASLHEAVAQIDTGAVGEPSFRLVVTGTGPGRHPRRWDHHLPTACACAVICKVAGPRLLG